MKEGDFEVGKLFFRGERVLAEARYNNPEGYSGSIFLMESDKREGWMVKNLPPGGESVDSELTRARYEASKETYTDPEDALENYRNRVEAYEAEEVFLSDEVN